MYGTELRMNVDLVTGYNENQTFALIARLVYRSCGVFV